MATRRLFALLLLAACGEVAEPAAPTFVLLVPTDTLVAFGARVPLSVRIAEGRASYTVAATWTVSDTTILALEGDTAVAVGNGTATVTASWESHTAQAELTVRQRLAALSLDADTLYLAAGDSGVVPAAAVDPNGHEVTGLALAWSLVDSALASIAPDGTIRGLTAGSTTLTVAADGQTAAATLVIENGFAARTIDNAAFANQATCAVDTAGRGYCFFGRLFTAPSGTHGLDPVPVPDTMRWLELSVGDRHICGIATDSAAYCWGRNHHGQLGLDTTGLELPTPQPVSGGRRWRRVAASDHDYTCGIDDGGIVRCWGHNDLGQLGRGTRASNDPAILPTVRELHAADLDAGALHTCALSETGAVHCWGQYLGHSTVLASDTVVRQDASPAFRDIASGIWHGCGIDQTGDWWCWDNHPPQLVATGLFVTVDAALYHACAVGTNGQAWCRGVNDQGQLGDGTTRDAEVPVPVRGLVRFRTLAAGDVRTCGISVHGYVYCWGGGYTTPRPVRAP